MIKDSLRLSCVLLLSIPCLGQNPQSSQSTTGNCSPILTGNHITVTCTDKKALSDLQALLNKIVQNQLPADKVMQKLDACLSELAKVAPRRLSEDQVNALVKNLSPLKGHTVNIFVNDGDGEAAAYASDFEAALSQAGVLVTLHQETRIPLRPAIAPGLIVFVNPTDRVNKTVPQDAIILLGAIRQSGIDVAGAVDMVDKGTFDLVVGTKPR